MHFKLAYWFNDIGLYNIKTEQRTHYWYYKHLEYTFKLLSIPISFLHRTTLLIMRSVKRSLAGVFWKHYSNEVLAAARHYSKRLWWSLWTPWIKFSRLRELLLTNYFNINQWLQVITKTHKMRSNGLCLKKNKVFKRKYLGPSSHLHIKFYWHCWWMGNLSGIVFLSLHWWL